MKSSIFADPVSKTTPCQDVKCAYTKLTISSTHLPLPSERRSPMQNPPIIKGCHPLASPTGHPPLHEQRHTQGPPRLQLNPVLRLLPSQDIHPLSRRLIESSHILKIACRQHSSIIIIPPYLRDPVFIPRRILLPGKNWKRARWTD